ncbi:MAG: hypothetical protein ACRD6X_21750, partial [Pyrinomonadaceae bacterium]
KAAKDHAVVFSEIDQKAGNFCFITLYAASQSEGSPQKDFAREWKTRVVEPWGGEATPKTETVPDNGWTGVAGGTQIEFNGTKAFAFLTVVSGFGKTVSVLGILNADSYLAPLQAFVENLDIDKTAATSTTKTAATASSASSTGPLQYDAYEHLIITPPTRQLTLADLVGNWGEAASFHQRYVYRDSGNYAGADSLTFKSKMTFTSDGGFYDDFYAIQNGKMIKEKTAGSISVSGRVLSIRQRNTAKYVIRGWLELPDMTVLEVCGPWYDDDVIPQEIFTNPAQGANLNKQWARKK